MLHICSTSVKGNGCIEIICGYPNNSLSLKGIKYKICSLKNFGSTYSSVLNRHFYVSYGSETQIYALHYGLLRVHWTSSVTEIGINLIRTFNVQVILLFISVTFSKHSHRFWQTIRQYEWIFWKQHIKIGKFHRHYDFVAPPLQNIFTEVFGKQHLLDYVH